VGFAWTEFRYPPRTYEEFENQTVTWLPESAVTQAPPRKR